MGSVSLAQANDAIAATIKPATQAPNRNGVTQSFDELGDGIGDTPTVQVYPQHGDDHAGPGEVNRGTFGGGPVRQRYWTFYIDVMAEERGIIAQNMAAVVTITSLIEDILDQQNSHPFFGLAGIQDFKWYWDRATVAYAGRFYSGTRFVLGIWVY